MGPDLIKKAIWALADDAGDAAIAVARLQTLKDIKRALDVAISDVEKLIADELPHGLTETPHGAVTVRKGAERYTYPKAGTDDYSRLFDHVVSRLMDQIDPEAPERPERQLALKLFEIWPMGAQNARSSKLKEVVGLRISDYREAHGRKSSVQLH